MRSAVLESVVERKLARDYKKMVAGEAENESSDDVKLIIQFGEAGVPALVLSTARIYQIVPGAAI